MRSMGFLYFAFVLLVSGDPFRIPNSPYPSPIAGPNQTKVLTLFDETKFSKGQIISLQTLQGLLARYNPQLFRSNARQNFFLSELVSQFHVAVDDSLQANYTALLSKFRSSVGGFVRFNATDDSVNVAISLCAANSNWISVDIADIPTVRQLGIPQTADATTLTMEEVLAKYSLGTNFSNRIASLQDPQKGGFLSDWSVFARGVTWFDTSTDFSAKTSKVILAALQPESAVFGWGVSEGATVDELALRQSFIHASDWALNMAVYNAFYVPNLVQNVRQPFKRQASTRKHTVSFLMTDGDNIQWLLNDFMAPAWFGSPDRGKFPLGWTVSPAMAELAPSVLKQYYSLSNETDNWVAGPSGIGYTIPERFPAGFEGFCSLTKDMMHKADLHIVNLIQDSADLGPSVKLLAEDGIDGAILYYGGQYSGGRGQLSWSPNNKPILTGRAALWDNDYDPVGLARLLRSLPKDPRNPQSYSLIPVHVWSHNVSDVLRVSQLLGAEGFEVVTPDVLVSRVGANVFHDCSHASPATGSFKESCSACQDSCGVLSGCKCGGGQAPATDRKSVV